MDVRILERRFHEMGARVKVREVRPRWDNRLRESLSVPRLDVRTDNKGEYFDIAFHGPGEPAEVSVVDVKAADRHLLLLVKSGPQAKSKFLCGHDERHWFVAAVPEKARGVSSVKTAKEALQPAGVKVALDLKKVRAGKRLKRHNQAFHRQGEWFFIPVVGLEVDEKRVLRNEPLSRGRGSKPHNMEFCYRVGGETVYVNERYPSGISQDAYSRLEAAERKRGWRIMRRDAGVYAKGRISHADHATIVLNGWHRVEMNTEREAAAMRHVAFLD
jgi:hypothetical protein